MDQEIKDLLRHQNALLESNVKMNHSILEEVRSMKRTYRFNDILKKLGSIITIVFVSYSLYTAYTNVMGLFSGISETSSSISEKIEGLADVESYFPSFIQGDEESSDDLEKKKFDLEGGSELPETKDNKQLLENLKNLLVN